MDASSMSKDAFWKLMLEDPVPRRLVSADFPRLSAEDFFQKYAEPIGGGSGWRFRDGGAVVDPDDPENDYILNGPEYQRDFISTIEKDLPQPDYVRRVRSRPVLSVGHRHTGETDMQHHWHGIGTMVLLAGQKQWALRPPDDEACQLGVKNACTDPLLVCKLPEDKKPACIQNAGEVLVLPAGWYHGTCNTAEWTVGVGGQGVLSEYLPLYTDSTLRHAITSDQVGPRKTRAVPLCMARLCIVPLYIATDDPGDL